MRAYHPRRGEADARRGHHHDLLPPCDAATPAAAGFKVITLTPGRGRLPGPRRVPRGGVRAHRRTDDRQPRGHGHLQPAYPRWSPIVHEAGGLCAYDQANANGMIGITRAARRRLRPVPVQPAQDVLLAPRLGGHAGRRLSASARSWRRSCRRRSWSTTARATASSTTGRSRSARSAPSRAFPRRSFGRSRGCSASGPRDCGRSPDRGAQQQLPGVAARRRAGPPVSFADTNSAHRLEQIRYSLAKLHEETGVGTLDVGRRTPTSASPATSRATIRGSCLSR